MKSDIEIRSGQAKKVTLLGFIANVILVIVKLAASIFGRSQAMLADTVHSTSDLLSDIVVYFSLLISERPADDTHKYGHGKFETLATLFVSITLFFAAFGIGQSAVKSIFNIINGDIPEKPKLIALIAALFSIIVKEIIYQYTNRVGKKIKSDMLIANAWHHRSDALSSIAAFFGLIVAIVFNEKWIILDPITAIVIALLICYTACKILFSSLNELLEIRLPKEVEERIVEIVNSISGTYDLHNLKTRKIGSTYAIEIHIRVERHLNIVEAHEITSNVENALRNEYGKSTHVQIHTEPLSL